MFDIIKVESRRAAGIIFEMKMRAKLRGEQFSLKYRHR
jgi:hypothetical protein